MTWISM